MTEIKAHSFRGKRYTVKDVSLAPAGCLGYCDWGNKRVYVPVAGDTLADLDAIIHEGLHACFPDMCEDAINESATSLAVMLWRLGWQKTAD
jgi:hypothetical protein